MEHTVIAVDLQQKMLDVLFHRAQRAGVADRIQPHCCRPDHIGAPPIETPSVRLTGVETSAVEE
jgi:16S rRNA C967 or C1407 C5-methylase (RsmB/RsmF family)